METRGEYGPASPPWFRRTRSAHVPVDAARVRGDTSGTARTAYVLIAINVAGTPVGIFSQIRDRRLFQIVASYLAAGWIGLTVVDQFVNRGIVPGLIYEIALIGYLCGIPAAFLVGWHHGEKGEQRAPRSEVAMLTTLALAFLVLSSFSVSDYWTTRRTLEAAQRESETDLSSIGVLYFEDYTGGEHRHIADALTEALIDELTRVPALDVR